MWNTWLPVSVQFSKVTGGERLACEKEPLGRTLFDGCTTFVEIFGGLWTPVCCFVPLTQYDVVCEYETRLCCDEVESARERSNR
jgi:hypothetical protein